ncbi:hypothetical protein [Sphingopyxis sp. H050]|nr:hypothetical protein [Sphingopyxis sp. H050]
MATAKIVHFFIVFLLVDPLVRRKNEAGRRFLPGSTAIPHGWR